MAFFPPSPLLFLAPWSMEVDGTREECHRGWGVEADAPGFESCRSQLKYHLPQEAFPDHSAPPNICHPLNYLIVYLFVSLSLPVRCQL